MTREQSEIIEGLRRVQLPIGAEFDKSFIEGMYFSKSNYDLSVKQNEWCFRLLYKYRVQLPDLYEKHKENELCKQKPKP